MRKILLLISFLLIFQNLSAEIVINEVMSNEPNSYTSLEWVEIYNDSIESVPLTACSLFFSNRTIALPESVTLEAGEYYIICQSLFGDINSPGFESYWGDNSGVWGDNSFEAGMQEPFDPVDGFSLLNTGSSVILTRNGLVVSGFFWSGSGLDGYSWERRLPQESTIEQSASKNGSTPGSLNSITPLPNDLSLDSVKVAVIDGEPLITFSVTNRGYNQISGAKIYLNTTARIPSLPALYQFDLPTVDVDETVLTTESVSMDGVYIDMTAYLSPDMRVENDSVTFTAVGFDYPPLIINEFVANPNTDLGTEWVEIKNISGSSVDLKNWRLGDSFNDYLIAGSSVLLSAGEYIILTPSSADFVSYYSDFNEALIEMPSWPALNNDADEVRLFDSLGIVADLFEYSETYDDNFSWSRSETIGRENFWGKSLDTGGTPGYKNTLYSENIGSGLSVELESDYLSPDGDGFEETALITVITPQADSYNMKIYDRYGRKVKTFFDESDFIPIETVWDGLDDDGKRLPIGVYIIFVEAVGVESRKVPIVIAR